MEKKLRAALTTSAENFLSTATKLGFNSAKPSLKTLIWNISPSSDLSSSLPLALQTSISHSIRSFQNIQDSNHPDCTSSARSPPSKRVRRSSRHSDSRVESAAEHHQSRPNQDKERVLHDLRVLAHIENLCVLHPENAFSPVDLLPAVRELHDNLVLFESDSALLTEIASLCEEWWKEGLPERESLVTQSLPYLLSKSLTSGKKVDVHRVYTLREALLLFDFEDESIEDLKLLLIRSLIAPLYLKTEEGRRFVAFTFGLNGQLVKEALAMIRAQIPLGRKSMLEAYADIVFRAWKLAEGAARSEIESVFLQGLIDGAIHASSEAFAASIRRVVGGFINQRTTVGVEKLLFQLVEPVIFRSLQVANSNVRLNALHLLLDMFPLEDPDSTKEVKDVLLDKQFFLLERLLTDECPSVRAVSVEGSCRILHLFWEVVSPSTITKILTKIFDDMSHDICNEVRLSTLNGIIFLLGNPQSHELLKVLLPRLGHLISDSVLSIRAAVVDLLTLLRDIRTFEFHKVVGMDKLLPLLEKDQPLVAQKVTRLIIPSYFPSKLDVEVACNRCQTLIRRSPLAGARFCEFALSGGASLEYLLELNRVLFSSALSPDKMDGDQIEGILVAASYICEHLITEAAYRSALKELLSGQKLKSLLAVAPTVRAKSSVLSIASKVSPDDGTGLVEDCIVLATSYSYLTDNSEKQAELRSVHMLLLSCGEFNALFDAITRVLQNVSYECHASFGIDKQKEKASSTKSMRSGKVSNRKSTKLKQGQGRKSSKLEESYSIAAGIGWQIKDLLMSENSRKAVLGSSSLRIAFFALKDIAEVSIVHCINCDYMDICPVSAYMNLALHMNIENASTNAPNSHKYRKHDVSAPSSSEGTLLEQTMDHLLTCTEKLFEAYYSGKFTESSSDFTQDDKHTNYVRQKCGKTQMADCSASDIGFNLTVQKKILNAVKMISLALKFIVDAVILGLLSHKCEKFLAFTSAYMQYVTSALSKHFHCEMQNKEDVEQIFVCLKSSITYAAKLLNLLLTKADEASPPLPEAHRLPSLLIDVILSIEVSFGYRYAARLITVVKPWLPDLVLALGSGNLRTQTPDDGACSGAVDGGNFDLPAWSSALARSELSGLIDGEDEGSSSALKPEQCLAFSKFIEMMVLLVKENHTVLDAVGLVFLSFIISALEHKDFGMVLGLVHFVCIKLVGQDTDVWRQLTMMLASLPNIYLNLEREPEELSGEDEMQKLLSAKALLEPVWAYCMTETDEGPTME